MMKIYLSFILLAFSISACEKATLESDTLSGSETKGDSALLEPTGPSTAIHNDETVIIVRRLRDDETSHAARSGGKIVLRNNCFGIEGQSGEARTLIFLRSAYLSSVEGNIQVKTKEGSFRVGDQVDVGGRDLAQDYAFHENAAFCPGPYWLLGKIIKNSQE